MQIPRAGNNMVSIIYVKFDHVDTGNSLVNSLLRNELKECVSITAITKTFLYSHKNETVTVSENNVHLSWAMQLLNIIFRVLLLNI